MLRTTILLVEDDREIRTLLGGYLTGEGFEVDLAEDGGAWTVRCGGARRISSSST